MKPGAKVPRACLCGHPASQPSPQQGQSQQGSQGKQQGQSQRGQKGETTGQAPQSQREQGAQQDRGKQGQQSQTGQKGQAQPGQAQQGQQGQAGGSTTLTTEQRTKIRQTVLTGGKVPRASNVNFSVSVGTAVPTSVRVVEVPSVIIDIHPEWRGFWYFVVGDEIIIVDRGHKIVAILAV